jgi:hypothetical protein
VPRFLAATLLLGFLAVPAAQAEVVRITITSRQPLFGGQAFGTIGPYEEIRGTAEGEIDPASPQNALITDIALAPRNARGRVEYKTTFTLRKPVDMSRAPGVLLYNIVNRGNHNGPDIFDVDGDPGDGFLYRLGHAILWSGWQGDMPIASVGPAQEGIDVPVARDPDGSAVTGRVWARFTHIPSATTTMPLPGATGRRPATLDTAAAALISATAESPAGAKRGVVAIPSDAWAFADCRRVPFPGTPDPTRVCLKDGFAPGRLYELVYTARDPFVLGVGMAAMRDVVSFFRYATHDQAGTANPAAGLFRYVVAMGNSQSGRFAKTFLNLGFNQDERGRIVWDGLNARIAGMLGGFNVRFALPGDIAELYDPGADGPLWWSDAPDPVRGRPAWGLLHRCQATGTCPKITETYGGPEMWYSHASVGITGTAGLADLPLPENVRRYYQPGTGHGGGRGGFRLGTASTTPGVLAENPNPQKETDRALYVDLVAWVVDGTPPPPSAYPRFGDGTLVAATAAAMGWPPIPGAPRPDGVVNPALEYDYGSTFRYLDESGVIANVPPPVTGTIPTLVPTVDRDGNEIAGVKSLLARVPLGTYTGWNPIPSGALEGRERSLAAGYIPFARTKAERLAAGDPRLSIEERYPSLQAYLSRATAEADALVRARFLLPADAARLLQQAIDDLTASGLFTR